MATTAGANLGRKSVIVFDAIALVPSVWALLGHLNKIFNREAGELQANNGRPPLC